MGSSTACSILCDPLTDTNRALGATKATASIVHHSTQSTQHHSARFLSNKSSQRSQRGLRGRSPLGDAQQEWLMQMQQLLTSSQQ